MTPDDRSPSESTDPDDARVIPGSDDKGKDVVDIHGREIGLVTDVEGDTMYVDPHPSTTEQIMSRLGWSDEGSEDLPVSSEFVERIEENVVLDVERDEEFQREAG